MKLVKVHLLHHFTTTIHLFGCAKNLIHPFQKKHKTKVKEHARRTRFQSVDFEFHTARKDYEDCVLHAAECEIISKDPDSVIVKFVGQH